MYEVQPTQSHNNWQHCIYLENASVLFDDNLYVYLCMSWLQHLTVFSIAKRSRILPNWNLLTLSEVCEISLWKKPISCCDVIGRVYVQMCVQKVASRQTICLIYAELVPMASPGIPTKLDILCYVEYLITYVIGH